MLKLQWVRGSVGSIMLLRARTTPDIFYQSQKKMICLCMKNLKKEEMIKGALWGRGRNWTDVKGFAVLCIAILPLGPWLFKCTIFYPWDQSVPSRTLFFQKKSALSPWPNSHCMVHDHFKSIEKKLVVHALHATWKALIPFCSPFAPLLLPPTRVKPIFL